MSTIKVSTLL